MRMRLSTMQLMNEKKMRFMRKSNLRVVTVVPLRPKQEPIKPTNRIAAGDFCT